MNSTSNDYIQPELIIVIVHSRMVTVYLTCTASYIREVEGKDFFKITGA